MPQKTIAQKISSKELVKVMNNIRSYSNDKLEEVLRDAAITISDMEQAAKISVNHMHDKRRRLHDVLLDSFVPYFAQESLPKLQPYTAQQASHLYRHEPMIRAKADSMVCSLMDVLRTESII